MISLKDKSVLVVGGTSGIGLAVAQSAAESGARVTVASRSEAKTRAAEAAIGGAAVGRLLDTTDAAAVETFFSQSTWDHVVVSAASVRAGLLRELPLDVATASMDSKFWGAYRVARAARFNEGGSLTFVAGYASHRPVRGRSIVCAINSALEGLGRALAVEFGPTVRVNVLSPGPIDTPLFGGADPEARRVMFENTAAKLPAGRVGAPQDAAQQIVLFMTNPFATGMTVYLDGGGLLA